MSGRDQNMCCGIENEEIVVESAEAAIVYMLSGRKNT
jgi:hypothetical protein